MVLSGTADVLVDSPSGARSRSRIVEPNSIVGEIAILCDVARTATVKASAPLETLRISKDHFLKLLAEFPEMAVEIMRVLADRLSHTTAELSEARSQLRRQAIDGAHHGPGMRRSRPCSRLPAGARALAAA